MFITGKSKKFQADISRRAIRRLEYIDLAMCLFDLKTPPGNGLLAAVTPACDVYCYHFNGVGSTVAITNSSQTVVNKYSYDPFGNVLPNQQLETISQPFKYVGQYGVMAEPNGYYYIKARHYDPTVGRFISEDPIGFNGGDTNLMAYVGNNPVTGIDPEGKFFVLGFLPGIVGSSASATMATMGVVMAGAAWWIINQVKTPNSGAPDSWYTNPNNGQERHYGQDGNPDVDIDWSHDHGAGKPHAHNWEDGKRGESVEISPWPKDRKPSNK